MLILITYIEPNSSSLTFSAADELLAHVERHGLINYAVPPPRQTNGKDGRVCIIGVHVKCE